MARDDDLSALLPEPPLPRNTRRDAAIETAMLRFDGREPAAATPPPPSARPSRWSILGRPQIGALLTAALVGVIAVPLWLSNLDQLAPRSPPARPAEGNASPTAPSAPSPAARPSAPQATQASMPAAKRAAPVRAEGGRPVQPVAPGRRAEIASETLSTAAEPMPAPAPAPPPPPPLPPPPPPPMAFAPAPAPAQTPRMAARAATAEDAAGEIVVTGSARAARGFAAQAESRRVRAQDRAIELGKWDACTVRDSARSLAACRKLVDPSASGRKGRAAAQVADGLSAAWRGDNDAAIAAFDRAIDQSPGLAFAWLNRGLAREAKGDTGRALSDLDKAVRLAPNDARVYYQRSLFLNRQGETRRAREDWERAIRLDPRLNSDDD